MIRSWFEKKHDGDSSASAGPKIPRHSGAWSTLRAVQAETTDVLLNGTLPPQALTVTALPSPTTAAVFSINPLTFIDGPYLDPFTNGVQAVPSAVSGAISITLSFAAWSASVAYAAGDYVTSSSVNYISLRDQNFNNTPASSPTFWEAVSGSSAIGANGFQGTDIGRVVRFLSEPAAWVAGTTYSSSATVSYNPSGVPGASTYWQSIANSNTGNPPGNRKRRNASQTSKNGSRNLTNRWTSPQ